MTAQRVDTGKATLCLPHTPFAMRASLLSSEKRYLGFWQQLDVYKQLLERRREAPLFVLHDGPPYASGDLQWSHVLNKILKDFVLRTRSMQGQRCEFIPGWDCHGLPIELEVEQQRETNGDISKLSMRRACREFAQQSITSQRSQFERLGILGHWDRAYITMSPQYQAAITRALAMLMRSSSLVQRTRPVFWCTENQTALAEFEVLYRPREVYEAYIAYPLISDPMHLDRNLRGREVEVVCWTTQVWTTPAVLALAVEPDTTYVAVRSQRKVYLVAEACLSAVAKACGWGDSPDVLVRIPGNTLLSLSCRHPLIHRKLPMIPLSGFRLDWGTGIMPFCPGHDPIHYAAAQEHHLELYSPLDEKGYFTEQAEPWGGQFVWDVEPKILRQLEIYDALLNPLGMKVVQKYPFSWRSEQPVIFRATPQWFVPMEHKKLRQRALDGLALMTWNPDWGEKRMASLLQRRSDWCLSRQRAWGVPLPIFYCKRCGETLLDPDHVERLADRFAAHECGADLWFEQPVESLLPTAEGELRCGRCGNHTFRKEEDIVDVWFDSGVSAWAVWGSGNQGTCVASLPVDMCLEGVDQFRGWFQGSLLSTLSLEQTLPFRTIVAHGRMVGEVSPLNTVTGRGNMPLNYRSTDTKDISGTLEKPTLSQEKRLSPQEVIEQWGAELLRLWVIREDFRKNRVFENQVKKPLVRLYRKVRNTFRFMLANLYDFEFSRHALEWELMEEVDQYVLHQLHHRLQRIYQHYEPLNFHLAWQELEEFCIADLSSFYFEVVKDSLYSSAPDWFARRSAQTAMYWIVDAMCRVLAPVLCFTAEEIWQHLHPEQSQNTSVHWQELISPSSIPTATDLAKIWDSLRLTRKQVLRAFSNRKQELHLTRSWEVGVRLYPNTEELREALELCDEALLPLALGVAQVEVAAKEKSPPKDAWRSSLGSMSMEMFRAPGRKCRRCRRVFKELQEASSQPVCSRCHRAVKQQLGVQEATEV